MTHWFKEKKSGKSYISWENLLNLLCFEDFPLSQPIDESETSPRARKMSLRNSALLGGVEHERIICAQGHLSRQT